MDKGQRVDVYIPVYIVHYSVYYSRIDLNAFTVAETLQVRMDSGGNNCNSSGHADCLCTLSNPDCAQSFEYAGFGDEKLRILPDVTTFFMFLRMYGQASPPGRVRDPRL